MKVQMWLRFNDLDPALEGDVSGWEGREKWVSVHAHLDPASSISSSI